MSVLNFYKEELEKTNIFEIGNSFVRKSSGDRFKIFGKFTVSAVEQSAGKTIYPSKRYIDLVPNEEHEKLSKIGSKENLNETILTSNKVQQKG